jgi:signal transduction histidine kinase
MTDEAKTGKAKTGEGDRPTASTVRDRSASQSQAAGQEAAERSQGTPAQSQASTHSLSRKLLVLTVLFVMIAEVLIFVPSVANTRLRWLEDRLNTAASASVVIQGLEELDLPPALQNETLMSTGTKAIVLRRDGATRLIAASDMPPAVTHQYDLTAVSPVTAIVDAFDTLFFGGDRIIRVFGPIGESDTIIEVVMEDAPLRTAMLIYGRNVLVLSLIISFITAGLVFLAINQLMIRPIKRMTASMQAFSEAPDDPARVITPGAGSDELGQAERHLEAMQRQLQRTLKEQKKLADLGLAVSKINHDMRNILASAQLMSDRLAMVDDPAVKRFAPKLLRTIDRAVGYTTEVLSYGKAREAEPKRRWLKLSRLVTDVRDLLALDPHAFEFVIDMSDTLEIEADSEQMFRVIYNLCRNAVEALGAHDPGDDALVRRVTVSALRTGSVVTIVVDDTGPGMPAAARANLFTPFSGSARAGGTGLGLAIARELVVAHGGTIMLADKAGPGTAFRIELPDQPLALTAYRPRGAAAGRP